MAEEAGSPIEEQTSESESTNENKIDPRRLFWIAGAFIFFVALFIRMVGMDWGLPNQDRDTSLHPDEPVILAYSLQIEPAKFNFTPGFYNYGTLYLTLSRIGYSFADTYAGASAEGKELWETVRSYHLAGRWISVVSGALTCFLVFLILWGRTHPLGAVFGAAALAIAPGHVVHSRFQTADVFAAMLLVGALAALLVFWDRKDPDSKPIKWLVLASALVGLSAGAKYVGAIGLVAILYVCWVKLPESKWRHMAIAVGVFFGAFLLATPGVLLESGAFWRDFTYELSHTAEGHGLVFVGTSHGLLYQIGNLSVGYGMASLIISVVGLSWAVARKQQWALPILIVLILTFLVIGRSEVKFFRYALPLIPLLAIGFGWCMGRAHLHPNQRFRIIPLVGIFAVSGFGGGGLHLSMTFSQWMASSDPRDQAGAILKEASGPDTTVGIVSDPWFYTVTLYPETAWPRAVPFAERDEARRAATNPRVIQYIPPDPNQRVEWDLRLLEVSPDYIVFSSFESFDYERIASMTNVPANLEETIQRYRTFMERLEEEYSLLQRPIGIGGPTIHDLMYVRPSVLIWKRKDLDPPSE